MKNFFDTKNKEIIIYCIWMLDILRKEGYIINFKWIRGHQKDNEIIEIFGNNYADSLAVSSHKDVNINDLEDIEKIVEELRKAIKK